MSHPAVGTMLQMDRRQAGLVALTCPSKTAPRLLLAPWRSTGVRIEKAADRVTIHWDNLAAIDPAAKIAGDVVATVTFQSAADGRSVTAQCRIENRSDVQINEVAFADLVGLATVRDAEPLEFRSGGIVVKPLEDLTPSNPDPLAARVVSYIGYWDVPIISRTKPDPLLASGVPGGPRRVILEADPDPLVGRVVSLAGGGYYNPMITRWFDLGTHCGGFSLFPRNWGLQPSMKVLLHLWLTKTLRLAVDHDVWLARGGTWESPSYWLAPHEAGWAKGIEPYRQWVRANARRVVPLPEHVRRGLGFRTAWMCHWNPADPEDVLFHFRDLPKLAREAKEHGLDEIALWDAIDSFELPLPPSYEHLGGDKEFVKAVAECKRLGVNVAPFVSVVEAKKKTAAKYGLKAVASNWNGHPESVPPCNPPYISGYSSAHVSTHNPLWQTEVLASCKKLVDMGIPSLAWDEYFAEPPEPNLLTLTRQIRAYSRQRDPQSTFCGEDCTIETTADYVDYTWNWCSRRDIAAATSAFATPRLNLNVDSSAEDVKTGFLQNAYLNVQPRRPDDINGSDWISNHAELSRALRQCAALRNRFIDYFLDGALVGDCLLAKGCAGATVGGYVLPARAILIVLNTSGKRQSFDLDLGLAPFLASASGKYHAVLRDAPGGAGADDPKNPLAKAPIIGAEAVKVHIGEPVLIDQAPPTVKHWGPYRMPKVFRLPSGEICLTFSVGLDYLQEQGKPSPAFVSTDEGKSWRQSTFPHPRMNGMNPLIVPIGDGEYYCLSASNGVPVDLAQMPKPLYERGGGYGTAFRLYRLEDCPADVRKWFQQQKAVRWSPKTVVWTEEAVDWDRRNQLVYCYLEPGDKWWTQSVYMEVPPLSDGKELLFADYWTLYAAGGGKAPGNWQCSLMVSGDNGRTWRRRSVMIDGEAYGDVSEPTLARNGAGELVSIIRRDPMPKLPTLIIYSRDNGYTWTRPKEMFDRGAFPQLLQLKNGVMVHSFGRPGVWLSFSLDGGHSWTEPQAVLQGPTCGYTSLLAMGRNDFLLAYSEFERPNQQGQRAKAILVRKITVNAAKWAKSRWPRQRHGPRERSRQSDQAG